MKFARVVTTAGPTPVAMVGTDVIDIGHLIHDITTDSLARLPAITAALSDRSLNTTHFRTVDLQDASFQSPISDAKAVIAVGMNYAAHAAESGSAVPVDPVMFLKTPNTIAGPDNAFVLPPWAHRLDWEVELAVIMRRQAYQLSAHDDPFSYVAGFTLADDISERTAQLDESGGQWSKGKCLPGSTPLGPWLVTPDDLDPTNVGLRSFINGKPRQDSSTKDMIFDCATIIRHLSKYVALEPGYVILTGTPAGVALSGRYPYLRPGDIVRVEGDYLGSQTHAIVTPADEPR